MSSNETTEEKLKTATVNLWDETWPNFSRKLERLDLCRDTADWYQICIYVLGFPYVHADTHKNVQKHAHYVHTVNNKKMSTEEVNNPENCHWSAPFLESAG